MTEEYTPMTDEVMETFAECGAESEAEANAREESFWRWYTAIEAAAEQRGAIKALWEAAESKSLIDHMYENLVANQPIVVRETSKYLHYFAEQYIKEENSDGR